jgi:hypothetical protein
VSWLWALVACSDEESQAAPRDGLWKRDFLGGEGGRGCWISELHSIYC